MTSVVRDRMENTSVTVEFTKFSINFSFKLTLVAFLSFLEILQRRAEGFLAKD